MELAIIIAVSVLVVMLVVEKIDHKGTKKELKESRAETVKAYAEVAKSHGTKIDTPSHGDNTIKKPAPRGPIAKRSDSMNDLKGYMNES